jgi:hypothetical protein
MCWPTQSSSARTKKVTGNKPSMTTARTHVCSSADLPVISTDRQLIELAILGAKVGDVGLGAHRPTGLALDKFVRLKLASMLIEMFAQPSMQRIEFTDCHLARNFGMCFESGSVELRTAMAASSSSVMSMARLKVWLSPVLNEAGRP